MTGRRFGKLLVLGPVEGRRSRTGRVLWRCQCDCGAGIKEYATNTVLSVGSCGCALYPGERAARATRKQAFSDMAQAAADLSAGPFRAALQVRK